MFVNGAWDCRWRDRVAAPRTLRVNDTIAERVTASGPMDRRSALSRAGRTSLASRRYHLVCFVGPAEASKDGPLIDGWIAPVTSCAIWRYAGGSVVAGSQARYYSKIRIKRMIDASPMVRDRLSLRRQDDLL